MESIKLLIEGFIIGIGKIIPGVSGAMLAITLGIYDKGINIISNFYITNSINSSTLLFNTKNLYNFLRRNGFSNKEFINITITNPSIILESIESIKQKLYELNSLGFNKLETINIFKNNFILHFL